MGVQGIRSPTFHAFYIALCPTFSRQRQPILPPRAIRHSRSTSASQRVYTPNKRLHDGAQNPGDVMVNTTFVDVSGILKPVKRRASARAPTHRAIA